MPLLLQPLRLLAANPAAAELAAGQVAEQEGRELTMARVHRPGAKLERPVRREVPRTCRRWYERQGMGWPPRADKNYK